MGKLIAFSIVVAALLLAVAVEYSAALNPECPLSSQVSNCSPKCKEDSECASSGKRCCPNICNQKSCVLPKSSSGSSVGYKGSSSGAGTYCANVKCNAFEKCELDKSTKRMKCVRT